MRSISTGNVQTIWALDNSNTVLRTADIMWPGSGTMTLGGNVTVTGSVTAPKRLRIS